MQNRPQDEVKVAVYAQSQATPERAAFQELALGLGLLASLWLYLSF